MGPWQNNQWCVLEGGGGGREELLESGGEWTDFFFTLRPLSLCLMGYPSHERYGATVFKYLSDAHLWAQVAGGVRALPPL